MLFYLQCALYFLYFILLCRMLNWVTSGYVQHFKTKGQESKSTYNDIYDMVYNIEYAFLKPRFIQVKYAPPRLIE